MDKLERQDATYLKARFWKQGIGYVAVNAFVHEVKEKLGGASSA